MAASVAIARSQFQGPNIGPYRTRTVDISFAAADYATGGYAISANSLGLNEVLGASVLGINNAAVTSSPMFQYNVNTGKLQAFGAAGSVTGLTELAAAADISAVKVRVLFYGV